MVTAGGAETLPFLASCGVLPASLAFFVLYGRILDLHLQRSMARSHISPPPALSLQGHRTAAAASRMRTSCVGRCSNLGSTWQSVARLLCEIPGRTAPRSAWRTRAH